MAFVPNTAAPAPIILHHTPSDTATPALLYPGEAAVCHGPTHTKMWIGDGVTNRLFLSTNPADSPLLNQSVLGGPFLPLTGGTLTGPGNLTLDGGTLTVLGVGSSTATRPTVIWDVTGVSPRQWRVDGDSWWGLLEDSNRVFYIGGSPPNSYGLNLSGNIVATGLTASGNVGVGGNLSATGTISAGGRATLSGGASVTGDVAINATGSTPRLQYTRLDPIANAQQLLGDIWTYGSAAIDNTPALNGVIAPGALTTGTGIRFVATQGWERDTTVDTGVDPPVITSEVWKKGSEIDFWVSRNDGPSVYRAMTLGQDGNLSLPHAVPTAAADVVTLGYLTGASTGFLSLTGGTLTGPGNLVLGGTLTLPRPTATWTIDADLSGEKWFAITSSASTPPGKGLWLHPTSGGAELEGYFRSYDQINAERGFYAESGGMRIHGNSSVVGDLELSSVWDQPSEPAILRLSRFAPVTQATQIGTIRAQSQAVDIQDPPGFENLGNFVAAEIRFNSTRGWVHDRVWDPGPPEALLSETIELGSEIAFWVSRNGGSAPYRAMTLQQDGNLSLPFAAPTAATDVVTLGYLTGASTGFLSLTGGTLSGPGNLAVNGTLAVSNSDTVSATITNTGSGATALKITNLSIHSTGIDIEVGGGASYAISTRGALYLQTSSNTLFWFAHNLQANTANTTMNLIDLGGDGGGILVRQASRANDPPGVYAVGIRRRSTHDTCPFIQMFDDSGVGLPIPSTPTRVLGSIWFGGYDGTSAVTPYHPQVLKSAAIYAEPTETWSGTANGSRIVFQTTPNGTTTAQTALTIDHDGSGGRLALHGDATTRLSFHSVDGGGTPQEWRVITDSAVVGDWVSRLSIGNTLTPTKYMEFTTHLGQSTVSVFGGLSADSFHSPYIIGQGLMMAASGTFVIGGSNNPVLSINSTALEPTNLTGIGVIGWAASRMEAGSPVIRPIANISVRATENWTGLPATNMGCEMRFVVVPNGTDAPQVGMVLENTRDLWVQGTVTASGSLLTSDPALKDDIAQAPSGALAKVCELPVIDFRWKHGRDSKMHRGFSADDVRRVMGEDSGCSAEGAYSLADMNAMLWRAVQELSAEVQELKQRMH